MIPFREFLMLVHLILRATIKRLFVQSLSAPARQVLIPGSKTAGVAEVQ